MNFNNFFCSCSQSIKKQQKRSTKNNTENTPKQRIGVRFLHQKLTDALKTSSFIGTDITFLYNHYITSLIYPLQDEINTFSAKNRAISEQMP